MLLVGLRDVEVGDSPGAQRDRLLRTTVGGATIAIWHHTKQNNNSIKGTKNEWKRQRRATRLRCVVLPICNQWNKRLRRWVLTVQLRMLYGLLLRTMKYCKDSCSLQRIPVRFVARISVLNYAENCLSWVEIGILCLLREKKN